MRVLVTRLAAEADSLAALLRRLGHEPILCPLLDIRRLQPAIDLTGVQALLFSSGAGMRAFAEINPERALPALTVGEASAEIARLLGFRAVASAAGDSAALAALAIARLDPKRGAVLHASGVDIAGDAGGTLSARGFDYRRVIVYEATPAKAIPPTAEGAVRTGAFEAVLFFSPRTVDTFVSLVNKAGLADRCRAATAFCLSAAVAAAAAALPWRLVRAAPTPDKPALLALLAAQDR